MKRATHATLAPPPRGPFPQELTAESVEFVSDQGQPSSQTDHPNAGAPDDQVRRTFPHVEASADLTDLAVCRRSVRPTGNRCPRERSRQSVERDVAEGDVTREKTLQDDGKAGARLVPAWAAEEDFWTVP
jgi:hypothetical protein